MAHHFDPNVEYVLPALDFDTAQKATMQMIAKVSTPC